MDLNANATVWDCTWPFLSERFPSLTCLPKAAKTSSCWSGEFVQVSGYVPEIFSKPLFLSAKNAQPFFPSQRNDAIFDVFISSCEQIFDVRLLLNWNDVQEFFCGGGKEFVKDFRNSKLLVMCSRDARSLIMSNAPLR